ncbi:hypothetical protein B484DRAFT_425157 [Ochromonadaceae sp. CCMP2298]|nr:hypothetical protein B484DRAFT_425157 [Ochromonadaceae sp. CCMP2298]
MLKSVMNMNAVRIVTMQGKYLMSQAPKFAIWGAPAGILVGWMIYPALGAEFKKSVGLP